MCGAQPRAASNMKWLSHCWGLDAVPGQTAIPLLPTLFPAEGEVCPANQIPVDSEWILGIGKEMVWSRELKEPPCSLRYTPGGGT